MASRPPPDQHKPSSMLSPWPFTTFNNPFPGPLQEDLESLTAVVSSQSVSSSPKPLSSQTFLGGSTTKVSKRRSRSATKPPIRVLSVDRSNFRDIVQKLTGLSTSLSMQGNGLQQTWENNSSALIKSMATRPNSQDDAAAAAHSLRTLDTSSAYLLVNGPSQRALMHDEINSNSDFSFLQSLQHPQPHMAAAAAGGDGSLDAAFYNELYYYNPSSSGDGGGGIDLKSLFVSQYDASKGTNMYSEGVSGREVSPNMLHMEHLDKIREAAELESFLLMGNDKLDDFYASGTLHNVNSWLSSDAIHTLTPTMELAHSA